MTCEHRRRPSSATSAATRRASCARRPSSSPADCSTPEGRPRADRDPAPADRRGALRRAAGHAPEHAGRGDHPQRPRRAGRPGEAGQALVEIESVAVGRGRGRLPGSAGGAAARAAQLTSGRTGLREEGIASEKEYLQARQELETAEIRAESARGVLTRLGMSAADVQRARTGVRRAGRLILRAPATARCSRCTPSRARSPGPRSPWSSSATTPRCGCGPTSTSATSPGSPGSSAAPAGGDRDREGLSGRGVPAAPWTSSARSMDEASRTVRLRVAVANPRGPPVRRHVRRREGACCPARRKRSRCPGAPCSRTRAAPSSSSTTTATTTCAGRSSSGRRWGDRVEVVKGLEAGETVVADGAFLLKSDVLRSKMGAGCAD